MLKQAVMYWELWLGLLLIPVLSKPLLRMWGVHIFPSMVGNLPRKSTQAFCHDAFSLRPHNLFASDKVLMIVALKEEAAAGVSFMVPFL